MLPQTNTAAQEAHSKLFQIFRYAQAFNHLQNPVQQDVEKQSWSLWLNNIPVHSCICLGTTSGEEDATPSLSPHQPTSLSDKKKALEFSSDNVILKVKRPTLTDPPAPPEEILPWLENGWQTINGQVRLTNKRIPKFNENPKRDQLLKQWQVDRERWVKKEQIAFKVMEVFNQLYTLRAQLERESERVELILGDGILDWDPAKTQNGVYHPILLIRLQLTFNAQVPEFILSTTEHAPEFYTSVLQTLPEINLTAIGRARQEFVQNTVHPLGNEDTTQFLKRLVNQLSPYGEFISHSISRTHRQYPSISRNPVIFLRSRSIGYNTAFEAILEHIPHQNDLPYSLLSLTGINAVNSGFNSQTSSDRFLPSLNGEDERILFSKPANKEQLEIARRLDHYGAVLVQGPPGTGKTHTIANLLGHLLAQGKSVLVTSHTSKALKVLREKVVEPLQPLCVSILEDDSRKEMERAVDTITERLSSINVNTLEQEASRLTQQRIKLIEELQKTRQQLLEARQSEYREIVLDGQTYAPSDAARYVAINSATHSWIPAPITLDSALLLTTEELVTLYRTNVTVTPQDEREMAIGLPDPQKIASPVEFDQWVQEHEHLMNEELNFRRDVWIAAPNIPSIEDFKQLQHRLIQALEPLKDSNQEQRWRLAAIAAGRAGGPSRQIWDDLIAKIEQVESLALQAQPLLIEHDPTLLESAFSLQTERTLDEILKHVERSGRLKGMALLLHRDWKALIEQAQVKGQRPETREHFRALHLFVRLLNARKDLAGRWQRQMSVLGATDAAALGQEPERICRQYIYQLQQCLSWFDTIWSPLEQELMRYGLQWNTILAEMPVNLSEHGELMRLANAVQEKLPPILAAEVNRHLYQANEARFLHELRVLDKSSQSQTYAEVVQRLRNAIKDYQPKSYHEAFTRLVELYERQSELRTRHSLLEKLRKCAPGWATAIRQRDGIHGQQELPTDPQEAWRWRQLHDTLELRSKVSLEHLQEHALHLNKNIHTVTAELVEKKAWAAQVRRTSLEQRRALQGWKEVMRKVGKGTGKRAAQLLAEARKLMPICQTAVPVWIMPLSRVVQNFDPRLNSFDVIIIDEASQADIKALAAVYMAKQIVVVGDDEQVTPMDVGQKLEQVDKLINEHLQGIPLASIYDGRLSIYALAKTTFEPVCLQEHFRCVSPIIQFSNMLSYNGKIKPLRDDSEVQRRPATVAYRVQAFDTPDHVNELEAQAIASLIIAASKQREYQNATFGAISMVGDKQALSIDSLLRQHLSAMKYTHHQILCGNPAQFQGDERDVIFLSLVDTPKGDGPLSLRSEDAFEYMYKKRFNVAASRARDQLWVVYSLDPHIDLKDGDVRKRIILHAQNPEHLITRLAEQEHKVDSEFERQVLSRLVQAGYRVVSQWPVGAYRIDLVVEGNGQRLAVECDGDRWHPPEKIEEDMARQAILERLGWRFVRIRGSHFFRNPDQALAPVFNRLQMLGISPSNHSTIMQSISTDGKELQDRILREAAMLRTQWQIGEE
ncbi:AAA domain-containing protein [Tengunoibacter tsumagoiensis]|uniref:Disulfide isomerase n=1 Tax=Tengunoibacter tsumagoiensis TaxID=2014871 RepID=A0A401ZZZ4_9CHLR|nr:AAA domain-containing protein [Tengunoibacter tsumagoiensis]GCE12396.1 disulfide isomerase [Tengunoibacter tsumagoiensis]